MIHYLQFCRPPGGLHHYLSPSASFAIAAPSWHRQPYINGHDRLPRPHLEFYSCSAARLVRAGLAPVSSHRHVLLVAYLRRGILCELQNRLVRQNPPLRGRDKCCAFCSSLGSFHIEPIQPRIFSGILFLHHDSWLSL